MANKRMFTMKIVDSDDFLDMSATAQNLYFHLNMRADDDGFVDKVERIMRDVKASKDDLNILIAKNFVIPFKDEHNHGILVIKHWRMHNTLSKNRYTPTDHIEEKSQLLLKDNGAYSLTEGKPIDDRKLIEQSDRQVRRTLDAQKTDADLDLDIDKDIDIDKGKDINRAKSTRFVPPTIDEVKDYCLERNNGIDAESFIDFYESKGWMVGKNKMKDWKAAIRTWERSRKPSNNKRTSNGGYDWDNI